MHGFTRVFLTKGLFSIGSVYVSDFKSMYLTRLGLCVRKGFVSNRLYVLELRKMNT